MVREKLCPFYYISYKMENMRVPELKALARDHGLRNYSRLRKADLIKLIRNDQLPLQSWEPSIPQRGLIPQRALN